MKKLPEVSNGKGDDVCVKKKKGFSLDKGSKVFFLFRAVSVEPTTLFCCLVFWAPRYVLGRSVGWSLHQVNKGKYEKCFRLLSVSIFSFCIFLLGLSLGKALRRLVNVGWNSVTKIWSQISYGNTALPLAPDPQKPSNPQALLTYLCFLYGL